MKDYGKIILNRLLDKHQGGKRGFEEGDSKKKAIRINTEKDPSFKDYFADDSYLFRDDIENAVKRLEDENLVSVTRDKQSGLLTYVALNQEPSALDKAYAITGHVRKKDIVSGEMEFLQRALKVSKERSVQRKYIECLLELEKERKSHLSYYSDLNDLNLQLKAIDAIEEQEEEILLRNFSVRVFGDSKWLEKNKEKILRLFNVFSDEKYQSADNLFAEHNIVRNPTFIYLRYGLKFEINGQVIDLDKLDDDFSLTDKEIESLKIDDISKKEVITIENLTTYFYYPEKEAIVIYLAGYHNSAKRRLLQKIYEYNPNLSFYHIGDIDCGGFNILMDLRKKTGIPFQPLMMGIKELKEHPNECKRLSENDKRKLMLLLDNPKASDFKYTVSYMLDNNVKLEQEALTFD